MSLPTTPRWPADEGVIVLIDGDESFAELVDKLSQCVLPVTRDNAPF